MSVLGPLLDATAFLTRVPLPARREFDLARAAWAFPVVGAALGLVLGTVGVLAAGPLGALVAAVLVVLVEVLLTGALHLDGLADSADGSGGRDRQARLRIMKDHAAGVYGVVAIVLDLLLKVALLSSLLDGAATPVVLALATIAWTLSRTAMLPLAVWLPYAREEGTGRGLVQGLTTRWTWAAAAWALALVAVATWAGIALAGTGFWVVPLGLLLTMALTALLVGVWARRTLGGVTGDVLGATAEVTLLAALLVGSVLI